MSKIVGIGANVCDTLMTVPCYPKEDTKMRAKSIVQSGGGPHAIGKNCFIAELQEPTDLMVIPEKVTPSGVVLSEQKLHCGLGFDKMFDCFNYYGCDKKETRSKYFKGPKKVNENELELIDCDKFRLNQLNVSGELEYKTDSYGIAVVLDGSADMNGIRLESGDRVFISEKEGILNLKGNAKILICRP